MPKMSKLKATFIIILACFGLIAGIKMFGQIFRPDNQSGGSAKVKGSKNAPIQIIEYADFQCPACAKGAQYIKNFMIANPDKVQAELKYYSLPMHQHSFMASRYAECASRQGKFWEFHDLVFERQDQWKGLVNAMPAFDAISQEIGLDMAQLNTCLRDPKVEQMIEQNKADGNQQGGKSTPSYFINGKMVVGYQSLAEELNRLIVEDKN